jgi:hypothetical protein
MPIWVHVSHSYILLTGRLKIGLLILRQPITVTHSAIHEAIRYIISERNVPSVCVCVRARARACACVPVYEEFRLQVVFLLVLSGFFSFEHSCNTSVTCLLDCVMVRGDTCEKEISIWRTQLLFMTRVEIIPSEYFPNKIATAS